MGAHEFAIRRLVQLVPTLLGLLVLIFLIARVMPGDPVRLALGPEATAEQVAALRNQLGLDQPLPVQFVNYLIGLVRGDFGVSLRTLRGVGSDIAGLLPATLELVTVSLLFSILLGVTAGIFSALYQNSWVDNLVRLTSISGVALPRFWVGILFQIFLASKLGLFPIIGRAAAPIHGPTGFYTLDALLAGNLPGFFDSLWHLVLPALTLALPTAAQLARLSRASMIEVLRQQYVLVHRAYGVPTSRLVLRYALRNSLTSVLTLLGLSFGSLIENAFLVEVVFSWPGISAYGAAAVLAKDFNAVVAVTLIVGLAFMLANLIVDLLYGVLDPRVRYD
ncbi:ABC transporter permease [Meiothermus sp. Pnk-1]|uniref:ABC transporter permease n=1 Tax=Meiothermus sp. Pnk-1 TaxID=873128 RepID=UPI000D7C822C|nr:ABC transporter permease [Meiothermus sp. Pnk-1]PZA07535.1 ABC transporter permease [Meiothermus sp. Pnk-1]